MMKTKLFLLFFFSLITMMNAQEQFKKNKETETFKVQKSSEQWQNELDADQYYVLREKGTERPFSGQYNLHFEEGVYACGACDAALFKSDTKFDAHCGWPSFDEAIEGAVSYNRDLSHGMVRTEILCSNCGGHLGHVFDDGPTETGKRYCVNSLSLDFDPSKEKN
jgi:peptide-methionine (R)-S-oxide reductase